MDSGSSVQVEVYDFTVLGRASCLNKSVDEDLGGAWRISPIRVRAHFRMGNIVDARIGHDPVAFFQVSLIILPRHETDLDLAHAYPRLEFRR